MGLKDFFRNRRLKKATKNGTAANINELKAQPSDELLCTLWTKCLGCKELLYTSELKKNLSICKHCSHHHRLTAHERIEQLTDYGSFIEIDENISPSDPLKFSDLKSYETRLKDAQKNAAAREAIVTGIGTIDNHGIALGVMEFEFIGGSMGCV